MEKDFKGGSVMMKRILTSLLMFSAMSAPAVLLLVLQFSSTLVRADMEKNGYQQQLIEPINPQLQQQARHHAHDDGYLGCGAGRK
jgi:hypothetical protein